MKRCYIFLLAVALLASCTKTDEAAYPAEVEATEKVTRSVGVKDDPYRLSLIQQVLDEKVAQTPGAERAVLEATDLYVRFLPKDSLQVMTLMQADIPHMFRPLNESVSYAPDSEYDIPEGFRWIYSVVPADYEFPEGIECETLYEVFIQRPAVGTRSSDNASPQLPEELYKSVLREALVRAGYLSPTRSGSGEEAWTPSARFRFVAGQGDRWTDTLALPNLPVYVFQGTYSQKLYTDAEGETGPFDPVTGEVDYRVSWDNEKFILWDGETFGIENRPNTWFDEERRGRLDRLFTEEDPLNHYRAGAFRAFNAYFHETRPGMEALVRREKLVHVALNDGPSAHRLSGYFDALESHPVKLWTKRNSGTYYTALEAMGASFHELGHASHYYKAPDNMVTRSKRNRESWANGVEYGYIKSFFPEYIWDWGANNEETRVIECMLKNGYSFDQIQFGFYGSTSWKTWHERMREFGVLDPRLLDLIFSAPNTWTFDMGDLIQVNVSGSLYKNQPIVAEFKPDVGAWVTAQWDVVEGTGAQVVHRGSRMLVAYFTEEGKKRIRATVTLQDGITQVWEREIEVSNRNLISAPGETVQNYEFRVGLLPTPEYPDAKALQWGLGGYAHIIERTATSVLFSFSQPGIRTVTVRVQFSASLPVIEYEVPISVKATDVSTLFAIVDRPDMFRYDTQYEAVYKGTGTIEVTDVGLNHNSFLPYYEFTTWSYDKTTSKLRFSIPGKPVPLDYTLLIFYKVNGTEVEDPAELTVSNYRER